MDSKRIVAFKSNLKKELDALIKNLNTSQKYNSAPQVETKKNTTNNKPVEPQKPVNNKPVTPTKPVNTNKPVTPTRPTNQQEELSDYDKCLQAPYNVYVKEKKELITFYYNDGTQETYLFCLMLLYKSVLCFGMVSDSGRGKDCFFTRRPNGNGGYIYTEIVGQEDIQNLRNQIIAYNNLFK